MYTCAVLKRIPNGGVRAICQVHLSVWYSKNSCQIIQKKEKELTGMPISKYRAVPYQSYLYCCRFLNCTSIGYMFSKAVYICSRTLAPVRTTFPETKTRITILGSAMR